MGAVLESNHPEHDPRPPRPGGWRVGDVVRVAEDQRLTTLGDGVVLDVQDVDGWVDSVLVRFEHGPAVGVWYSVGTLERLRDLEGRPLTPTGRYAATRATTKEEPEERPASAPPPLTADPTPSQGPAAPSDPSAAASARRRASRPQALVRPRRTPATPSRPKPPNGSKTPSPSHRWQSGDRVRLRRGRVLASEPATGVVQALQTSRGRPTTDSVGWLVIRLDDGEVVTRWHEAVERLASQPVRDTPPMTGARVRCSFGPGRVGRVVADPPRFPSGTLWPLGWLEVELPNGRRERIHALHLAPAELALGVRARVIDGRGLPGEPRTGVVVALQDNRSRPANAEAIRWVTLELDGRGALHRCWHEYVERPSLGGSGPGRR